MHFEYMIIVIIQSASVPGANYVEQTDWIGDTEVQGPALYIEYP